MNRSTEFSALSPAYLRLYSRLREEIVNQAYRYEEKLPSKRNMAANSGVSTVTVEHAYALLAEEG
uniref:GntR family transcriptional regulator n=1 Tax=Bilophila wadsworthia TaxID=35833 RepID=UPI003FEEC102